MDPGAVGAGTGAWCAGCVRAECGVAGVGFRLSWAEVGDPAREKRPCLLSARFTAGSRRDSDFVPRLQAKP